MHQGQRKKNFLQLFPAADRRVPLDNIIEENLSSFLLDIGGSGGEVEATIIRVETLKEY